MSRSYFIVLREWNTPFPKWNDARLQTGAIIQTQRNIMSYWFDHNNNNLTDIHDANFNNFSFQYWKIINKTWHLNVHLKWLLFSSSNISLGDSVIDEMLLFKKMFQTCSTLLIPVLVSAARPGLRWTKLLPVWNSCNNFLALCPLSFRRTLTKYSIVFGKHNRQFFFNKHYVIPIHLVTQIAVRKAGFIGTYLERLCLRKYAANFTGVAGVQGIHVTVHPPPTPPRQ